MVGGFAIMAFLQLGFALAAAVALSTRGGKAGTTYYAVVLVLTQLAAFVGGYAAAALAPGRPRAHAAGVAIMIFAMAVSQAAQLPPGEPVWYPTTQAVLGPLFAILGGLLRRPRTPAQVPI